MRRFLRRLSIAFAILVALVVVALVVTVALIHTNWGQGKVIGLVRDIASDAGFEVSIDSFELSLFRLGIEARGLELTGSDDQPLATVARASAALELWDLIGGDIVLSRVEVERPRVRLVVMGDGRIANLPELPPSEEEPKQEGEGWGFWLQRLLLEDADITVELPELRPEGPSTASITGLSVDIDGPSPGTYDIALRTDGGSVDLPDVQHQLEALDLDALVSPERVELSRLRLALGPLQLDAGEGGFDLSEALDGGVRLELDLRSLSVVPELLPAVPDIGGQLSIDAQVGMDEGTPTVQGRISVEGLQVLLIPPEDPEAARPVVGDLELEVGLQEGLVTISSLRLEHSSGGQLTAEGATLDINDVSLPLNATVELSELALVPVMASLGLASPRVSTEIGGALVVSGTLSPLSLGVEARELMAVDVVLEDVEPRPMPESGQRSRRLPRLRLNGEVSVGAERAEVVQLEIGYARGLTPRPALRVEGLVPYSPEAPVRMELAPISSGISLGTVGDTIGVPMTGRVRLRGDLGGSWSALEASGQVDVDELTYEGRTVEEIHARARFRDGVVTLPQLEASTRGSRVRVTEARVDLSGEHGIDGRGRVELAPVRLEDAVALGGVADSAGEVGGTLRGSADVRLRGGLDGLQVDFQGQVPELSWADEALGQLDLDVAYQGGAIEVDEVSLRRPRGQGALLVSGTVSRRQELDLELEIDGLTLPSLPGVLPEGLDVGAVIDADIAVQGTVEELQGEGQLALTNTQVAGITLGDSALDFDLEQGVLSARGAIAGEVVRLEALTFELSEPYQMSVHGVLDIPEVAELVPEEMLPAGVSGRLRAEIDVEGAVSDLSTLQGRVAIDRLGGEGVGYAAEAQRPLVFELDDGEIRSSGTRLFVRASQVPVADTDEGSEGASDGESDEPSSESADQAESSEATADDGRPGAVVQLVAVSLGLSEPWPLRGRVVVGVSDISRLLGPGAVPADLRVLAELQAGVAVDLADLDTLRGQAVLRQLQARRGGLRLRPQAPVELEFTNTGVEISQARFVIEDASGSNGRLELSGRATMDELELSADGNLRLSVVAPLVEAVREMGGDLMIDLDVSGSPSAPLVIGSARIAGVHAEIAGVPGVISEGFADLRFSRDVILLDRLEARALGGSVRAEGRVTLDGLGLGESHLDLYLSDISYPIGPQSVVVLDGDIDVEGPREGEELPLITGRAEIERLSYREPINLGLDVGSVMQRVRGGQTAARTFEPGAAMVRLDVRVLENGRLTINNNLADARVHLDAATGGLRVVGTNQVLGALGVVRIERGSMVTFRDNEFEVERGLLRFQSRQDILAGLDIVATTSLRDWTVTLRVTGSTNDPRVVLISDPALNELDILMLLATGMTRSEVLQSGGSTIILDVVTQGLDTEIEEVLPFFDEFRLTSDYSSRRGQVVPQVYVGRSLTDRLEVGATTSLTADREFEARLQYEFREWLGVEATYSNEAAASWGDIGADVTFRHEW